VNARIEFSKRVMTRTIGVHVRNISGAILWHNVIDSIGDFLWSLSVKEKKSNGIFFIVKNVVQQRWTSKTRISPNKFDVTQ
jgi:hypothetical protein